MPTLRLLLSFAIAFSLVSLPSVLSNNFILPSIPVVKAQQETTYGSWYPAGAQEQTVSVSQGDGASITQVNWLLTNQVDSEDWSILTRAAGTRCFQRAALPTVLLDHPVERPTTVPIRVYVQHERSREVFSTRGRSKSEALTFALQPNTL